MDDILHHTIAISIFPDLRKNNTPELSSIGSYREITKSVPSGNYAFLFKMTMTSKDMTSKIIDMLDKHYSQLIDATLVYTHINTVNVYEYILWSYYRYHCIWVYKRVFVILTPESFYHDMIRATAQSIRDYVEISSIKSCIHFKYLIYKLLERSYTVDYIVTKIVSHVIELECDIIEARRRDHGMMGMEVYACNSSITYIEQKIDNLMKALEYLRELGHDMSCFSRIFSRVNKILQ